MDQRTEVVLTTIALVLLVGIMTWLYFRYRRTKELRERFGPEYDRVVQNEGNVRRAEGVLEFREKKRETLHIRPLTSSSRLDFSDRWNAVQSQFVDDPGGSVAKADSLVNQLMEARGYPMSNFEERADIISVDHPLVVEDYRAAHTVALDRSRGQVTTEALRKAMVHYRSLFDQLLHDTHTERKQARA
ncbi:MAG TPA: hypothetical protein VLL05_15185 [Terriglobales bacterium]|nr:hypothetical protein [Terriglobales bacterium]